MGDQESARDRLREARKKQEIASQLLLTSGVPNRVGGLKFTQIKRSMPANVTAFTYPKSDKDQYPKKQIWMHLTWIACYNANSYCIYAQGDDEYDILLGSTTSAQCLVGGLPLDSFFSFFVSAVNATGTGPESVKLYCQVTSS